MTKQEVIWLLIRIAGLYSLAKGLLSAFEILGSIIILLTSDTPQVFRSLIGTYIGTTIGSLVLSALGLYLINDGKYIFRVLDRQPRASEHSI